MIKCQMTSDWGIFVRIFNRWLLLPQLPRGQGEDPKSLRVPLPLRLVFLFLIFLLSQKFWISRIFGSIMSHCVELKFFPRITFPNIILINYKNEICDVEWSAWWVIFVRIFYSWLLLSARTKQAAMRFDQRSLRLSQRHR